MIKTVNLKKIQQNYENMRLHCGKPLIFMVKADAYGHGAAEVVKCVQAPLYGVATVGEGAALREVTNTDIMVTAPLVSELPVAANKALTVCVNGYDCAIAAVNCGIKRAQIKVNSGMNRLGIGDEKTAYGVSKLLAESGVTVVGACTHYKQSDIANLNAQNAIFDKIAAAVKSGVVAGGGNPLQVKTNVTACGAPCAAPYDMLRVGIAAYGYDECGCGVSLCPAMEVSSEILQVKRLSAGSTVGYGSGVRAEHDCTVATVCGGYADGVSRSECGRYVLVKNKRCRILAVCMDTFEILLDNVDATAGDSVIIMSEKVPANYVAKNIGTIGYEVLVGYGGRTKTRYVYE